MNPSRARNEVLVRTQKTVRYAAHPYYLLMFWAVPDTRHAACIFVGRGDELNLFVWNVVMYDVLLMD